MHLAGGAGDVGQTSGQRIGGWLSAFALAVALAGCAVTPSAVSPDSPREVKEKLTADRSKGYWEALSKGNYEGAYAYLSPGSQQALSFERFKASMQSTQITYRDVKTDKVTCDGAACTTQITITYDHPMTKGVTTADEQRWIIDNGQAWLVRN